ANAFNCPARVKGLSTAEWLAREKVVYAIELLHATGITYDAAARQVIRGYKLDNVSKKEVLSWRREFKKGKVTNRRAMKFYDDKMAWLKEESAEQLQWNAARLFDEAFVSELLSREILERHVKAAFESRRNPRGE